MSMPRPLLCVAVLVAVPNTVNAQIAIDVIGGSEITFSGLIQTDIDWYGEDGQNLSSDGNDSDAQLRRAELVLNGKGPCMWNWALGYDAYANNFLDANVSYRTNGSTFMLGQFKQPNSLEELSSTKNNDFMSLAMTTNLFAMGRRAGLGYAYTDLHWGLEASYFGNELTPNQSPSLGTGYGWGARAYHAPINEQAHFLHLGLSYVDLEARNSSGQAQARLRTRPDADLSATRLIDTGDFSADRLKVFGIESAYVRGPFKIQAELMDNTVTRPSPYGSFNGGSYYVYGIWNLTGETWNYRNGLVTTPLPNQGNLGMWQLGVRYDNADLNDGSVTYADPSDPTVAQVTGILGGEEENWTVGLNWYWRSNFKVAVNYVMVRSSKYQSSENAVVEDNPEITTLRLQFYW